METELAPSVLDLVVASLTQVKMPTHWLSISRSELEALEFLRDLCWLTIIETGFLWRLPFWSTSSLFIFPFGSLQLWILSRLVNAGHCNKMHIDSWIMHQTCENVIQRWSLSLSAMRLPLYSEAMRVKISLSAFKIWVRPRLDAACGGS